MRHPGGKLHNRLLGLPCWKRLTTRGAEFQKFRWRALKRVCQPHNVEQSNVSLPAFYATQIASREATFERKLFLRQVSCLA